MSNKLLDEIDARYEKLVDENAALRERIAKLRDEVELHSDWCLRCQILRAADDAAAKENP